jgi:hypothetical protein
MSEVIGGGSLEEAIEKGELLKPELLGYQAWISWRAGAGLRPTQKKSGFGTTPAQEAELWRKTMTKLYGSDWRTLLEDKELQRAEEAEAAALQERAERLRAETRRKMAADATMAALGMDDELLADALELDDEEPSRRRENTRSSGMSSEAPPSPRALKELIREPFDPDRETIDGFEKRIFRLAGALAECGQPLSGEELQELVLRASCRRQLFALPKNERVGRIKQLFGALLVDDEKDRAEVDLRMSVLRELLEEHGGRLSTAADKLFSTPSKSGRSADSPPRTPERGQSRKNESPKQENAKEDAESLRRQLFAAQKRVLDLEQEQRVPKSPGLSDKNSDVADVANTLADALKGQTETLKAILSSHSSAPPRKRATIQVSPKVVWPILNDSCTDHKSVQDFYDSFESTVQLANDGEGMNALELLTTLRACLKEHRLKSYELIYKKHQAAGTLKADPEKVYSEIKNKHLLFAETREEREIRVLEEGDRLDKGRLSAFQFETLWEEHLNERAEVGLRGSICCSTTVKLDLLWPKKFERTSGSDRMELEKRCFEALQLGKKPTKLLKSSKR